MDEVVGVFFDRPADWVVHPDIPRGGTTVGFAQKPLDRAQVGASIQVSMEDNGIPTTIRMTPNPKAALFQTLKIDGQPTRLVVFPVPTSGDRPSTAELMKIATAKGTRSYTLQLIYPQEFSSMRAAIMGAPCFGGR